MTTRIAPSPTGNPHLGLVRTAYLNYLAAKSTNGRFLLRIDDTDKERSKSEYVTKIINVLDWLNIEYDDIFFQSQRLNRHNEVIWCFKNFILFIE